MMHWRCWPASARRPPSDTPSSSSPLPAWCACYWYSRMISSEWATLPRFELHSIHASQVSNILSESVSAFFPLQKLAQLYVTSCAMLTTPIWPFVTLTFAGYRGQCRGHKACIFPLPGWVPIHPVSQRIPAGVYVPWSWLVFISHCLSCQCYILLAITGAFVFQLFVD